MHLKLLTISALLVMALSTQADITPAKPSVHPALAQHQARLSEPKLVKVSQRVYAAIGYDIANFVFIIGDDGIILFDTGMQTSTSAQALADFRKISQKPIAAIIYSHGHLDHAGGVRAFVDNNTEIPIYAGSSWRSYRFEEAIPKTPIRALYQMGVMLPVGDEGTVGAGTGPIVRFNSATEFLPPNQEVTTDTELSLNIAGVNIVLRAMASDILDGITAWLPDDEVVLTGDLIYPHLPAIATPRFEKEREVWRNLESIEWVRQLSAKHLVPGHLHVVSGAENVQQFVLNFRDVIQFMNDQTIRLLRNGLGPLETAERIRELMPAHLREDPNLGEYYHKLDWIVRGLYTKSGGWYTGDVIDLIKITPQQRAIRFVALAGGAAALKEAIEQAYKANDLPWAAEMGRHLQLARPKDKSATILLATVLRAAAYQQQTANARNYLLTEAMVLEAKIKLEQIPVGISRPDHLRPIDNKYLLRALAVRLNPETSRNVDMVVALKIRGDDKESDHTLTVRKGVLDIQAGNRKPSDLAVSINRETFLQLAGANIQWQDALVSKQLNADSLEKFEQFARLFYAR
ncbi:MAG: alkyl sulfatase dimerization domain-containing protein [Pseudomonadales bacterium]